MSLWVLLAFYCIILGSDRTEDSHWLEIQIFIPSVSFQCLVPGDLEPELFGLASSPSFLILLNPAWFNLSA